MKRALIIWLFIGIPLFLALNVTGARLGTAGYPLWLLFLITSGPIIVLLFFLFMLPAFNRLFNNTFLGQGKEAGRILKTGRSAVATVLLIRENSQGGVLTINDQPVLNLKLLIEDGNSKPYEVSLDTLIPRTKLPRFQPGAEFKVKVDLENQNKIVIDTNEKI